MCQCASAFYGQCLREAGCETAPAVGAFTLHDVYLSSCVDLVMKYDCPNTNICSINCATDGQINPLTTRMVPVNNYGPYHLRVKICAKGVHPEILAKYSLVEQGFCGAGQGLSSFDSICSRFLPPFSFVPVALPINATSIEVDSCVTSAVVNGTAQYQCVTNPRPLRVYGSKVMWPRSVDVIPQDWTNSVCNDNSDCLGSYCDFRLNPQVCAPKSARHVQLSGKHYFDDAYG
jgi:hypothetical protein